MVAIVETGAANLASVRAAFERLGEPVELVRDAQSVTAAERLVLPGVGAFGAARRRLDELGVSDALRERIRAGRSTLGICLGLQLLCEASDESPGVEGLGVVPGRIGRFQAERVPQLGWNGVAGGAVAPGYAYFANSFRATAAPPGWAVSWADYGGRFVAALRRGDVLACQFHPELSGAWGADVLRGWLAGTSPRAGDAPGGPARRIVPCLDVRDGRVVKGVRFADLRDAGDPVEQAARYAAEGADELVLLDVSATPEGRANAAHTVAAVRAAIDIPLTVGGGVRTPDDAGRLLDAGADKVGVNTAAVARPALLRELAERFGRQCTVLALDGAACAAGFEVVTHSGRTRTGLDAVGWARAAVDLGAGEILLTSWDRDGTRAGYDLGLLEAICGAVEVPVIASGGADHPGHMGDAFGAGASAVLAASIFHQQEWTVSAVKAALRTAGWEVRPC